ncbi:hypothetical protein GY45DRAFT_571663 [Cubamyces sp. BRFM 1775]|nr:hypothetical protein GY45DRAFT_571663 [Cubamyces sp. BRFM 1775]
MRSPMIAFSLFAAVSPTLIAAAPQSPKFANDAIPHPNADLKFPQHFAVPRQFSEFAGILPGNALPVPVPGAEGQPSDATAVPDESLPSSSEAGVPQASTPKGTKDIKDMKAVLASKLPPKSAAATGPTSDAAADPAMALNHPAEPEEPKAPSFVATPPASAASSPADTVQSDSSALSKDVDHDGAVSDVSDEHASGV